MKCRLFEVRTSPTLRVSPSRSQPRNWWWDFTPDGTPSPISLFSSATSLPLDSPSPFGWTRRREEEITSHPGRRLFRDWKYFLVKDYLLVHHPCGDDHFRPHLICAERHLCRVPELPVSVEQYMDPWSLISQGPVGGLLISSPTGVQLLPLGTQVSE